MFRLKEWAVLIGMGVLTAISPVSVLAAQPKLVSEFWGKNVTTGSDWKNPVEAKYLDVMRYRLKITNPESGTSARDVKVRIMLPSVQRSLVLTPASYVTAGNTKAHDVYAETEIESKDLALEYVPGTARLTKNGSTTNMSPDTDLENISIKAINIGNIAGGDGNAAVIEFEAKVVEKKELTKKSTTPTPTPTPTGTATSAAVAKTTPNTGLTDPLWINTLTWLSVGGAGVGLKIMATRISRKAEHAGK